MRNAFLTFILSSGLLLLYANVNANVVTVTNTNDSGSGSLRQAAASAASGDTIKFSPSLISSGSATITLTSGEIDFGNKAVTIIGLYNSTDTLFISGNNNSRIFSFNGAGKVILDSLVLINGNGVGATQNGNGGAVLYYNGTDTLFIKNCVIRNNSASNGDGGGVFSFSSFPYSVSIANSTITGNSTNDGSGGGVFSYSTTTVTVSIANSTITGNSAGDSGGGVFSDAITTTVSIINSTITGNSALGGGGGILSRSSYPSSATTVSIVNSTISGNSAFDDGGGVYSYSYSTTSVSIVNSTISGNSAAAGSGVYSESAYRTVTISIVNSTISGNSASDYGCIFSNADSSSIINIFNSTITGNSAVYYGGGVSSFSSSASSEINIISSIVALNTKGGNENNFYNNKTPTITSGGYNIFGDSISGVVATDQINITATQLNLQPLAFNGGTTKTMLPGPGSVAINMGNPNDNNDAQNGPICGRRDVGAAETGLSFSTASITTCDSYTSPSGKYTWTTSGTYKDTIPNAAGCDSIITINLTIPVIDTSVTVNPPVITSNATGATYQWLDCNNNLSPIQGATSQSFTAPSTGNYAVEVTYNGCKDTSSCHYVVVAGLYANDFGNKLSAYPNPNHGAFKIDLGDKYNKIKITIIDLTGKLVYKNVFYNTQIADINIKGISSGVYYVRITSGNKQAMLKIRVQ